MQERGPPGTAAVTSLRRALLAADALREPLALRRREPLGLVRRIGQIREHDETERDGRGTLEQEQPVPALKTVPAVELEQQARERLADDGRERNGDHKPRHGARALRAGKPAAQVIEDAGQEARLGDAEQE